MDIFLVEESGPNRSSKGLPMTQTMSQFLLGYLPLVVFIEIFSFFLRPISHSVRLFANMLAGHIALAVFASFIPLLAGLGIVGYFGAILPLGMVIALTALELLVAFLQAYVFTILTCIYINDAIHPGH